MKDPIEVLKTALKTRAEDYSYHLRCGSMGSEAYRTKRELCEELLEELERLTRGQS